MEKPALPLFSLVVVPQERLEAVPMIRLDVAVKLLARCSTCAAPTPPHPRAPPHREQR